MKYARFNSSLESKKIIFLQSFKPGKCKHGIARFLGVEPTSDNLISEVVLQRKQTTQPGAL